MPSGGARKGSGRKLVSDRPMKKTAVTLPQTTIAGLATLGEGNLSAGIRRMWSERKDEMNNQLIVKNPFLSRKWGYGYTSMLDGSGKLRLSPVEAPVHTGTLNQVRAACAEDRTLASFRTGGTSYHGAWFYGGIEIAGVVGYDSFADWFQDAEMDRHFDKPVAAVTLILA